MKIYTIKTYYSIEEYLCENIDRFLASVCFCDAYEVIKEEAATNETINKYNEAIKAGCMELYASNYALNYISLDEAIKESLY